MHACNLHALDPIMNSRFFLSFYQDTTEVNYIFHAYIQILLNFMTRDSLDGDMFNVANTLSGSDKQRKRTE
jgi:hypothetical protein